MAILAAAAHRRLALILLAFAIYPALSVSDEREGRSHNSIRRRLRKDDAAALAVARNAGRNEPPDEWRLFEIRQLDGSAIRGGASKVTSDSADVLLGMGPLSATKLDELSMSIATEAPSSSPRRRPSTRPSDVPSIERSPMPSEPPTPFPLSTASPTPPLQLNMVGNNGSPPEAFPLGRCQGDCDADRDCQTGLICMQRDPDDIVPGCIGSDASKTDYCIGRPSPAHLWRMGENGVPANAFPLGACDGDCDIDADCAPGLKCFQRVAFEEVPGCEGEGTEREDYCYNPRLGPSSSPSVSPNVSVAADGGLSGKSSEELKTFETAFDSDATYAGNMFDLYAKRNLAISQMGVHIYLKSDINVRIYTRIGSYVGAENDISQWMLVANSTVKGEGLGVPTMIPGGFDPPIYMRQNERRAFYITTNGPWLRCTKGMASPADGLDISLMQGVGTRYPMTDGTRPDRIWNGLLKYRTVDSVPLPAASGKVTFRRGDLAVDISHLGIKVSTGMSVRVLARANQKVLLANGQLSNINFHSMPDGAAVLPLKDGGFAYVSNSEMKQGLGGVYGLYFDASGNVVDYKMLLDGTTRNCAGGVTPWRTWVSCEEYGRGQCWQVDPEGEKPPRITSLGGSGGNYESVAVDNSIPNRPIFYVTEDSERGALRQYTPPILRSEVDGSPYVGWDTLHTSRGMTRYLEFLDGNRFVWALSEERARNSQQQHFPNVEGIDYHDGFLYFVSKKTSMLYILDLFNNTYTMSTTKGGISMWNGGDFRGSPDQIVRSNGGDYLYLTEDGGKRVGVYAIHQPTGQRYAIFEAYDAKYFHDETTGLAFSPDGKKMYASFQDCDCNNSESGLDLTCGCLMEFSRTDGRSFDGSTMSLKFHSK